MLRFVNSFFPFFLFSGASKMQVKDYVVMAIVAWIGVFAINRGLKAMGYGQYAA